MHKWGILSWGILAIFLIAVGFTVVRQRPQNSQRRTGKQLYQINCASCHGLDRAGKPPTFPSLIDIRKRKTRQEVQQQIRNGKNIMPAFRHLSDAEVQAIISYLFGEGNPVVKSTPLPQAKRGEIVFQANCARCHRKTINDPLPQGLPQEHPMMPPAPLAGATKRFRKKEFFQILNMGPMYMPSFSYLKKAEKEALWAYAKTLEGKGEPVGPTMMQMYFRMRGGEHPGMMGMMDRGSLAKNQTATVITVQTLSRVIQNHIEHGAALNGGYYVVFDKQTDQPLMLQLEKIHNDRLSKVSDSLYFACVDMRSREGKRYDIDFFIQQKNKALIVSKVIVHKVNGKPRYIWRYRNGYWEQEWR